MAIDPDAQRSLDELESTLRDVAAVLDVEDMKRSIRDLEDEAASPGLWDDPEHAQRVTSKLSYLQGEINRLESLQEKVDDLRVLFELAAGEDDAGTLAEAQQELSGIRAQVGELEVRTLLSGPYDERGALVTVNAQAGGVDAADWTEMVLRMYTRWAERKGYPVDVYDTSYAEGAGLKSATFTVTAPYAYGTLRGEHGTHRLVRISPFDSQNRRQTSFAGVDVAPVVELTDHIEVPDDELRVDVYRSSGPGGQSVNTTDSAVRITHQPTGIVVSCQNERSQLQNRARAMEVLKAKLLERKQQQEQAAIAGLRGEATTSWGTQIRNYVLHPYQMVKDLRTEVETSNTDGVLDGELDSFIEAEIRWRRQRESAAAAEA